MNHDPNEELAGNPAINAELHEIVNSPVFNEVSQRRMLKRIREARNACRKQGSECSDAYARHAFREFLPAKQLNSNGYRLEYSANVDGKTPDWYDATRRLLLEVFTCERGGQSDLGQRVAARIEEKVSSYAGIVEARLLFFVVAVYGDFATGMDADDCEGAIEAAQLFQRFPILSGVVFFTEKNVRVVQRDDGTSVRKQEYMYEFFRNPFALRKVDLSASLGLSRSTA